MSPKTISKAALILKSSTASLESKRAAASFLDRGAARSEKIRAALKTAGSFQGAKKHA